MTREEQLKQAINQSVCMNTKYSGNASPQHNIELAMSDVSILRHADPEIMKQAGWVREYIHCANCGGGHIRPCNHCGDSGYHKIAFSLADVNKMMRDAAQKVFDYFVDYPTTYSDKEKYLDKNYPLPQPPNQ